MPSSAATSGSSRRHVQIWLILNSVGVQFRHIPHCYDHVTALSRISMYNALLYLSRDPRTTKVYVQKWPGNSIYKRPAKPIWGCFPKQ